MAELEIAELPKPDVNARYAEASTVRRHFLSWRRALFAGYFAIVGVAAKLALDIWEGHPHLAALILIVASPIGIGFAYAALRTRVLYCHADRALRNIENGLPSNLHQDMHDKHEPERPLGLHTVVELAIYVYLSLMLLICGVVLLAR